MPFVEATKAAIGLFSLSAKNLLYHAYVIDLSSWRDPRGQPNFRPLDGTHPIVQKWISSDPRFPALRASVRQLAGDIIKGQSRAWLSIALQDTHGTHISPAIAELLAEDLSNRGFNVGVTHVALQKKGV